RDALPRCRHRRRLSPCSLSCTGKPAASSVLPLVLAFVERARRVQQPDEDHLADLRVPLERDAVLVPHYEQCLAPAFIAGVPYSAFEAHSAAEKRGAREAERRRVLRDADVFVEHDLVGARLEMDVIGLERDRLHVAYFPLLVVEIYLAR